MPRLPSHRWTSRLSGVLSALSVAGSLAGLTACSGIGLGSVTVGSNVEVVDAGASGDGSATPGPKDNPTPVVDSGAASDAAHYTEETRSPLCDVSLYHCDPDKPACIYDIADGGTRLCELASTCVGATVPYAAAACRVIDNKSVCSAAIGPQGEGMACKESSDCAAELECVGSGDDSNGGVCRHYCCDLSCTAPGAFCDIESVYGAEQLVPVCTTGAPCTPLASHCPDEQTCTVVDAATAQTACATPGTAPLGADCTMAKCEKDLACITGTCQALCVVGGSSYACPSGQTCMPLTALGDGTGICTTM